MPFLCREIPFLLAWPVFCGILKGLSTVKDLGLSIRPQRGKRERRDSAVSGGAVLCMSCAVDPSTSLASAVRLLHLGKLQVRKVLNKSKMVDLPEGGKMPGLQCPSPRGWSAQQGQGLGCCSSSATDSAHQAKGWGALPAPHSEKIYFKG